MESAVFLQRTRIIAARRLVGRVAIVHLRPGSGVDATWYSTDSTLSATRRCNLLFRFKARVTKRGADIVLTADLSGSHICLLKGTGA